MGVSRPHSRSRVHPPDCPGSLRRRLHGQLGQQRVPGHPGPHLRPPLRAGLPARARRGAQPGEARARGHLPPQARGGRPQGRRGARDDAEAAAAQRQARGLRRCRPGLADRGPRPGHPGLRRDGVRRRAEGRRLHAHAGAALPPARGGHRRGGRLHPRPGRGVPVRPVHRLDEGAAAGGLGRGLRRLRRAARPRPGRARPPGGRGPHPSGHRLAGLGVLRTRQAGGPARDRAGRWQHRDGLLPLGAPPGCGRREGGGAQHLRGHEGLALGEGGCHARGHPHPSLPRAQGLRARERQARGHAFRGGQVGLRRPGPPQPGAHRRARGAARVRRGAGGRGPGEFLPLDRARRRHRVRPLGPAATGRRHAAEHGAQGLLRR